MIENLFFMVKVKKDIFTARQRPFFGVENTSAAL
jgi:hypothetical protein